jgi:Flp pilus assembly CpaF family ATPase
MASIRLDEGRTVLADKVLDRKKRPRIYDQTEKFYEEYRKEQAKNISSSGAALLGLIRDTVKRLDAVIGELNELRNAVGMSEILLLANARVYYGALQSRGGKARAAKLSPAQRKEIAKKAIATRWAKKEKAGK